MKTTFHSLHVTILKLQERTNYGWVEQLLFAQLQEVSWVFDNPSFQEGECRATRWVSLNMLPNTLSCSASSHLLVSVFASRLNCSSWAVFLSSRKHCLSSFFQSIAINTSFNSFATTWAFMAEAGFVETLSLLYGGWSLCPSTYTHFYRRWFCAVTLLLSQQHHCYIYTDGKVQQAHIEWAL